MKIKMVAIPFLIIALLFSGINSNATRLNSNRQLEDVSESPESSNPNVKCPEIEGCEDCENYESSNTPSSESPNESSLPENASNSPNPESTENPSQKSSDNPTSDSSSNSQDPNHNNPSTETNSDTTSQSPESESSSTQPGTGRLLRYLSESALKCTKCDEDKKYYLTSKGTCNKCDIEGCLKCEENTSSSASLEPTDLVNDSQSPSIPIQESSSTSQSRLSLNKQVSLSTPESTSSNMPQESSLNLPMKESESICVLCDESNGYKVDGNGRCIKSCKEDETPATCTKCSIKFNHCLKCTEDNCIECQRNYQLNTNQTECVLIGGQKKRSSSSGGLSGGAIAGVVIAAVAVVVVVALLASFVPGLASAAPATATVSSGAVNISNASNTAYQGTLTSEQTL